MRLRLNFGSHPTVAKVFGYDAQNRRAAVLLDYGDGSKGFEVVGLGELQLLGPGDTLGNLDEIEAEVRGRTSLRIND